MTVFETKYSIKKALFCFLGSAIFVALGYWITTDPEVMKRSFRRKPPQFGWVFIGVFGLPALLGLYQLINRKIIIRFDARGVYAAKLSDNILPWELIHSSSRQNRMSEVNPQVWAILNLIPGTNIKFNVGYKMTKMINIGSTFVGARFLLNGYEDHPDDIWEALQIAFQRYKR